MLNDKQERFNGLSKARLEKVIGALGVLGNCSNRSAYEYTENDVQAIFKVIEDKTRQTESLFRFHRSVEMRDDSVNRTWKELASELYNHGVDNMAFSKVQWGQNCVRFIIPNSPVWITCYSAQFRDPKNRVYGVFMSFKGKFNKKKKKINFSVRMSTL